MPDTTTATTAPTYPVAVPQTAPPPPAPLRLVPRDAPESEVRAVSAALGLAFKGDQIARVITGGVPGLHDAHIFRTVATGVLDLEVYTVSDKDEVLGVMIVKPPGYPHRWSPNCEGPHAAEAGALVRGNPHVEANYALLKKVLGGLEKEAFGPNEVTDTYYISHLGVVPAAQGRGVGAGLLNYMVARGRDVGVPVTLLTMTEGHEKYYKRFGFKTRAYTELEVGGEHTRWWAMSTDV